VWWALGFAAVTTAGLALLGWGLLVMHALIYGIAAAIGPGTIAAPDYARYRLGFTVAVIVNLVSALVLARLAWRTPGRTWPPVLQGLVAAGLAAVAAGCAFLIAVGINPVDFVLAL
jgi:hypothetical protein